MNPENEKSHENEKLKHEKITYNLVHSPNPSVKTSSDNACNFLPEGFPSPSNHPAKTYI